jgi:hypothetical protein
MQTYEQAVQEDANIKAKARKQALYNSKSRREKIQQRAQEYGTLTTALLNGSLTKWLFILILLSGAISAFNSISEDHWLSISTVDGQEIYTFNEDAYELDYTSYSVLGETIITNFENISDTLNIGIQTYETIRLGIEAVYNFLEPNLFQKVEDGYLAFIDTWFGWFEQFRRD